MGRGEGLGRRVRSWRRLRRCEGPATPVCCGSSAVAGGLTGAKEVLHGSPLTCNETMRSELFLGFWFLFPLGFVLWQQACGDSCLPLARSGPRALACAPHQPAGRAFF